MTLSDNIKRGREDCAPKVKHSTFGAQSGDRLSKGDFECAVAGTHHINAGRNSNAGMTGSRCRNAFAIGRIYRYLCLNRRTNHYITITNSDFAAFHVGDNTDTAGAIINTDIIDIKEVHSTEAFS